MQQNDHFLVARLEERVSDIIKSDIKLLLLSGQETEAVDVSFKVSLRFLAAQIWSGFKVLENGSFA